MTPHVCPVCSGNGLVPNGFYNQTSGNWTGSAVTPFEKCRSCEGTGLVWQYLLGEIINEDSDTSGNVEEIDFAYCRTITVDFAKLQKQSDNYKANNDWPK